MVQRKLIAASLITAALVIGGLTAAWLMPSSTLVLQVRVLRIEPAGIFDDADGQMSFVILAFTKSATATDILYFQSGGARATARVAGRWTPVLPAINLGSFAPNETKEAVLLIPAGADACRIQLRYVGPSVRWRLGGTLWRRWGIRLPPAYWAWAGWPNPAGHHPLWKRTTVQFSLPSAR